MSLFQGNWNPLPGLWLDPGGNTTAKRRRASIASFSRVRTNPSTHGRVARSGPLITKVNHPAGYFQSGDAGKANRIHLRHSSWSHSLLAGSTVVYANGIRPAYSRLTFAWSTNHLMEEKPRC